MVRFTANMINIPTLAHRRRNNAEEGSMTARWFASAGLPARKGLPAGTVIVYTPRNREELEICYSLFFESYYFACKFVREKAVQATRPELPDSKIAEQSGRVDWAGGDLQAAGCRNNRKASA
jgi:hypothetical protein